MCSIDEALDQLKLTQQSMNTQNQAVADIINTSNSVLLQVEGHLKSHDPVQQNTKLMRCRKESIQAFAEIVERLNGIQSIPQSPTTFDFLRFRNQRLEFLSVSVRKLLAMFDGIENLIGNLASHENEYQWNEDEECALNLPFDQEN